MPIKAIEDIEDGKWVELEATVIQLWENTHGSIRQVGLLKDDTGIVRFVSWEISDQPLLVEGVTYHFKYLPASAYDGLLSVAIVSTSEIERVGPVTKQDEIPVV